jgi:hypothetical protein
MGWVAIIDLPTRLSIAPKICDWSMSVPVTTDIEPPHQAPALDRCLPDRRVNRLSAPRDVARQTYVYRHQACHHSSPMPTITHASFQKTLF